MKKALAILLVLAFAGTVCFAQTDTAKPAPVAPVVKPAVTMASKAETFVGKVVSGIVADPAKGITKSTVNVVDEMGKTTVFTVKSTAKVLDKTLNVITLGQLKTGDKVQVKAKEKQAETIEVK